MAKREYRPVRRGVPLHIYNAWYHMNARCYKPNTQYFEHYGGRGIQVCERWRNSVADFFADMGDRPRGYTIDRIDCDGHYEPSNCRWATWKTQANNRRNNNVIVHDGASRTVAEWCEYLGIRPASLHQRIERHGIAVALSLDFALQTAEQPEVCESKPRRKPFSRNGIRRRNATSSRFVGVSLCHGGYEAYLKKGSSFVFRKWFKRELDAALARDKAAKEFFGEAARLNFPEAFRGEANTVELRLVAGVRNE